MQIAPKNYCSGCTSCFNICSHNAISMQADGEGFFYPVIDDSKCTLCMQCKKICPALNDAVRSGQNSNPSAYAAINKNKEVRSKSSSGGIFSLLAEYCFENKGVVFGAAFDENFTVKHIEAKNVQELERLRGSKYVQSQIGNTFIAAKQYLEQGIQVLFSGTPCQIAGLHNFLGKPYGNLLTVDIVCHGVPSPLVFEKYLDELLHNKKLTKDNIESIQFRDKVQGWHTATFTIKSKSNDIIYQNGLYSDIWGLGFGLNLYLRPYCTGCSYSKIPRIADITLADYWGVDTFDPDMDDNKGTSLILINNEHGQYFFDKINDKFKWKKILLEDALVLNNNIIIPSDKHKNRKQFFAEFTWSPNQCLKQRIDFNLKQLNTDRKKAVGILNYVIENHNYGAVLISYSLSKIISGFGYVPYSIDLPIYQRQQLYEKFGSIEFYKFRERELNVTPECLSNKDLQNLNNFFDTFITGSDQVWRQEITTTKQDCYFLNFVDNRKKKIAYAASFGLENFDGSIEANISARKYLPALDFVSVRENEGKQICSNLFNVDAELVLDPTLLLEESTYIDLIEKNLCKKTDLKYMAYYFIGDFENKIAIAGIQKINEYALSNKLEIINLKGEYVTIGNKTIFKYKSIYEWLNWIRYADFIITDSYHGVLFSIIFQKQFVCTGKKLVALTRFSSIFSLLHIKNRFVATLDEIDINQLNQNPIDYKAVHSILEKERRKSLCFLENALKYQFTSEEYARKKELYEQERFEQLEQTYIQRINQLTDQLKGIIIDNRHTLLKRTRTRDSNGVLSIKLIFMGMPIVEKKVYTDYYEWYLVKIRLFKKKFKLRIK